MVGDNLATDIEFGINTGVRTLLVMGGEYGTYVCQKAADPLLRCHQARTDLRRQP